jgi:hypothetical protein
MATVDSVQVNIGLDFVLTGTGAALNGQTINLTALNEGPETLNSTSTPPVSQHYAKTLTCLGGATPVSIDLTALTDVEGAAFSGLGKKVQLLRVKTPTTNAGSVTLGPGETDGYELFGTSKSIDVPPGSQIVMYWNDELGDIGEEAAGSGSGSSSGSGSGSASYAGTTLEVTGALNDTITVELGIG